MNAAKNFHRQYDVLIAGAGIIGLAVAKTIKARHPNISIAILEKEDRVAFHGSGRNSGVLHAGFYYTAQSLKAKLTKDGNAALRRYCFEKNIRINPTRKLVVAQSESDVDGVKELYRRGQVNGVEVQLVDNKQMAEIDPNVKSIDVALYSPTTATVDPTEVCRSVRDDLVASGVQFLYSEGFQKSLSNNEILSTRGNVFEFSTFVNCAGLYADQIAKHFEHGLDYTIIPFKGMYLKYTKADKPIKVNVYPVPNLKNPFLGVHYTITVDGHVKIGPTAVPAFWRENYTGLNRFKFSEFTSILLRESELLMKNSFGFRSLAMEEIRKYNRSHFTRLATNMLHSIDPGGFTEWTRPGIRAQLLNLNTNELVQDFVVESSANSVHVLNAISPAFTSSFPFSEWIYENHLRSRLAQPVQSAPSNL